MSFQFADMCNKEAILEQAKKQVEKLLEDRNNIRPPPHTTSVTTIVSEENGSGQDQITEITETQEVIEEPMMAQDDNRLIIPTEIERSARRMERSPSPVQDPFWTMDEIIAKQEKEESTQAKEVESETQRQEKAKRLFEDTAGLSPDHSYQEELTQLQDELESQKVSYLVEIEEFREEGIPLYKEVDINSDLSTIKLCHAFMNERSVRQAHMNTIKWAMNLSCDIWGKSADWLQTPKPENDSREWRIAFKENIKNGKFDIQIRKLVRRYKRVNLPQEINLLLLMHNDKEKFDTRRSKEQEKKAKEAIQIVEERTNEWSSQLEKL